MPTADRSQRLPATLIRSFVHLAGVAQHCVFQCVARCALLLYYTCNNLNYKCCTIICTTPLINAWVRMSDFSMRFFFISLINIAMKQLFRSFLDEIKSTNLFNNKNTLIHLNIIQSYIIIFDNIYNYSLTIKNACSIKSFASKPFGRCNTNS